MLNEISDLMERLEQAYSRLDIELILDLTDAPYFLSTSIGSIFYEDHQSAAQSLTQSFAFNKAKGMVTIEQQLVSVHRLSDSAALAITSLSAKKADGSVISTANHTFILRKKPDGWKLISQISDGPLVQRVAATWPHDVQSNLS
jgi:Domain of unknown function (DUF4440)